MVYEGFGKFSAREDFRKKFPNWPKTAFTAKIKTQQSFAKQVRILSYNFSAQQSPAK
jgi:hypothetical protein